MEETTGDALPSVSAVMEETLETPAEEKVELEESKEEVASYAEEVEAAIVAEVNEGELEEVSEETSEDTLATSVKATAKEVTEGVTEEVTEETEDEPAAEQKSSISISHSDSTEQQLIETQPPQTGTDIICSLGKSVKFSGQFLYPK